MLTGAIAWFLVLAGLYAAKAVTRWRSVAAEACHPNRAGFLNGISVALMLIGTGLVRYVPGLAEPIWLVAVVGNVAFVVHAIRRWMSAPSDAVMVTPAWFIPTVGNAVATAAGVALGYPEIAWFCFAIAVGLWLALFPVVMGRLLAGEPLPQPLTPTLVILLAPPSPIFLGWMDLNGGVLDAAARVLFDIDLFIALCLATMARRFLATPWSLSSLAYTFPLAALAGAALRYHQAAGTGASEVLALGLLCLATAVVLAVVAETVRRFAAGDFFRPEP
jgi:tellurite resistance protein